ncbi:V-type proton ATPase subunit F, partial [Phasianus colchicus]|uniref:V-type proton ATPase subunit F n=1 Tax=Phasianus colchicus TaxID=9054 RepID=UPI00129D931A
GSTEDPIGKCCSPLSPKEVLLSPCPHSDILVSHSPHISANPTGVPGPLPPPPTPRLPPSPRSFLTRDDIGIILINQCVAELIRHAVEAHTRSLPAVLEIPSKEHPYDAARDSVLRRARGMFTADDLR